MSRFAFRLGLAGLELAGLGLAGMALATSVMSSGNTVSQTAEIARGKYLVAVGGCNDCHTPGYFLGKPDMTRYLGGSEIGFEIPGLGVFYGPNLTPDRDTGLGQWSTEDIATAITKGRRPDGRELAPSMPWQAFANLTRQDALAITNFLKSLPSVKNKVPGPSGPTEKPRAACWVSAEAYNFCRPFRRPLSSCPAPPWRHIAL
jgi:mono/diheme cytochrome c family protein